MTATKAVPKWQTFAIVFRIGPTRLNSAPLTPSAWSPVNPRGDFTPEVRVDVTTSIEGEIVVERISKSPKRVTPVVARAWVNDRIKLIMAQMIKNEWTVWEHEFDGPVVEIKIAGRRKNTLKPGGVFLHTKVQL